MDKPVKLYATDDRLLIHHLKNSLQSAGINCYIKNDMIYSLAGEVPVNEVWPELWIEHEDQLSIAKQHLASIIAPENRQTQEWVCRQCGERHDGQFTNCWQCGAEKLVNNESTS